METAPVRADTVTERPEGVVSEVMSPSRAILPSTSRAAGAPERVAEGTEPSGKFSTRRMDGVMVETLTVRPRGVVTLTV